MIKFLFYILHFVTSGFIVLHFHPKNRTIQKWDSLLFCIVISTKRIIKIQTTILLSKNTIQKKILKQFFCFWFQSTPDELKACYRRLCMVYHPDKHDQTKHKEASEIFRKIQTAYSGKVFILKFFCILPNALVYFESRYTLLHL